MFIKFIICYYAFTVGLATWLGLRSYQSIVLPIGVVIVALSLIIYPNYVAEKNFASKIWPYYAIPFEFGIPLLLWVVAKIRKL